LNEVDERGGEKEVPLLLQGRVRELKNQKRSNAALDQGCRGSNVYKGGKRYCLRRGFNWFAIGKDISVKEGIGCTDT